MPQLKQLSCCIQWADSGAPFQEHGTVYGDGVVETFVVVPNKPQGFCIRLTSRGFVHEGLVTVVFIDGNYQCNRSRVNLLPSNKTRPVNRTEIDFLLRQREKSQGDGIYLGREWRFDNHNIVAEPPAGFQDSHFDDLGTIEVLVLRCRARNREDADYEGSSSGEDSDIFANRSETEDGGGSSAAPVAQPPVASGGVAQTSSAQQPTVEEDVGMAFTGLFDGANDLTDLPAQEGGYDGTSGRWIWHQSHPPFAGFPDPPQYHQPEGHRFRSQSYARPPPLSPYEMYRDRRNVSGPAGKKVHFDDLRTRQGGTGITYLEKSAELRQSQPQRPASRVRERWPSNGLQNASTQSYDPQRIHTSLRETNGRDAEETQTRHQTGNPSYHNDPLPARSYGDDSGQHIHSKATTAFYQDRPRHRYQPPQAGQANNNSQHTDRSQPFTSTQQDTRTASHHLSSEAHFHDNSTPSLPRQNSAYSTQDNPPRESAWADTRRASRGDHNSHISCSEYPRIPEPNHECLDQHAAAPYPYMPAYPYPYPTQLPHGYYYPQTQPVGYWPSSYPYPYVPGHAQVPPGRQTAIRIHEPNSFPPGFEEHISPTNVEQDMDSRPGSYGGLDQDTAGQGQSNVSADWNKNSNGEGGGTPNWGHGPSNDANNEALNNDSGHEGGNPDQNTGEGENANGFGDQENVYQENQNDDPNTGDGDQNDDSWGDNNANAGADGADWNGNGDNANQDSDNWNTIVADNAASGGVEGWEAGTGEAEALASACRDLYGPHGPYYALQATRIGDLRPDAEEEPRYDVPKALALERRSTKQVQPGPGYRYYKKRIVPEYIDTLDNPYARFVFKYRTKDQLLKEVGIEVDIEPSGDSEIQDLQNLDKQALIEMLLRAKSALGGKVPSPPATPLSMVNDSEANARIAVDAPKRPYLKYTLPALRPNNTNSANKPLDAAKSEPKAGNAGKENKTDWGSQNGDNGVGWNDDGNKNTKKVDWGANGTWDGPATGSPMRPASLQASQQGSNAGSTQLKQTSLAGIVGGNRPNTDPYNTPARPPTPDNVAPQRDPAVDNWDKDEESTSGTNAGNETATVW